MCAFALLVVCAFALLYMYIVLCASVLLVVCASAFMSSNSELEYLNTNVTRYKSMNMKSMGKCLQTPKFLFGKETLNLQDGVVIITHLFVFWSPLKCVHKTL